MNESDEYISVSLDDCAGSPCVVNATCVDLVNDYECHCPKGFKGKRCNIKEDLCASAPCTHGLCVDTLFDRRCVCNEGWTGENCDVNIDDCAPQPCKNGGTSTCTNLGALYHCDCPLGFDGTHCEHNKDDCAHGHCDKAGTEFCEDGINTFNCVCKPGYSGRLCEIRTSQCAFSPCMNNGTCNDEGASYKCECASGWTGATCEQETGTCDTHPCRNDGQCVNLVADYFCVCPEGVSGKNCEITPNRCLGEPCLNGGVCGDFGSRQECSCPRKYTGPGCQYLRNACTESVCQNDGECNRTSDGGFHCSCKPGFTGIYCETNIDDCARSPCPLGATCIDQINSAYCRCPFNMTGANCDKAIDEDYDLHFFDPLRPSSASLALPFIINTKAIAVALWVKFDQIFGCIFSLAPVVFMFEPVCFICYRPIFLEHIEPMKANYSANVTEVLRIDSEGVTIALFSNENPLQLHYPMNQKINDGSWNHLVFTWSSELGTYSLIWNSVRIFAGDGYGVGREIKINALITLGSLEAEETFFAGFITRVYIWSRVLDFNSEIPMMVASCREAELVYDKLLLRFAGYTEMKGKVERIPNSTCGRAKRKRPESTVKATSCPSDQFVITPQREVNVTWPEPEFQSKNPLEKVLTNFKQGQVFTWGEYDVLYVGFDNISNTAECSFKIHVSREHCPSPEDPVNGVQACESWGPNLRYKACSVECNDGYEFSRPPAIFYTCAADGIWRPRQRNQLMFRYPQCTKSVPATRVVLLRVSYPGSSPCSEASREALRNRILANIQIINEKWDICTLTDQTGCVGIRIEVDCSDEFARVKRESHSFNVRVELPVKRDFVTHSISGQKFRVIDVIQTEIINHGAFNLEKVLPNGRPDLTSFKVLDEFHCQAGQVTVNDMCVPCAPGSFFSMSTSHCELCAEGEYQPLAGRTECFKCAAGQVTAGPGAISENECKASCPPGHYFNMASSQCVSCGLGFFQHRSGSFECIPCDVGKTTISETAVSEEECRDECPDGEQLSFSGSCQPCPAGFYRTRGVHKQCVACPTGTTTESVGSIRREQCNTPRCKVGQFLVKETKHCQFCPRGTFQDEEQHTTCKLCPVDHTTAAQGAISESQCYSTNQCSTGEDNCSWHAHCIDLPDDNDLPSFQCKCKPGFRGNGTYCQDACTNYCLNDGVCKKNPIGYVECACKENFSGERCEVRFQPKSQRFAIITAGIEAPRPVGYYYEDDDEYEAKAMYVAREDDSKEIEQRRRIAQQHMYRPSQTD
ncbi:unnamed protein product [Angiostrongylus costaricensis]|uniref:Sushi, nidogen and EGF-like domain-containing protein 1 n=1 Tax=Angiostrongylus costaricensis TaxID=334426 RepID=A0A158PHD9_ANGCS|nr:unnamed protein product [Angiostrongylus costaricensis]